MRDKTLNDARGARINCINFQQCPFCYGCRNYTSYDLECQICLQENKKINICKTDVHKADLISKMVQRNTVKL